MAQSIKNGQNRQPKSSLIPKCDTLERKRYKMEKIAINKYKKYDWHKQNRKIYIMRERENQKPQRLDAQEMIQCHKRQLQYNFLQFYICADDDIETIQNDIQKDLEKKEENKNWKQQTESDSDSDSE